MRFTREYPQDTCKDKKKFAWLPTMIDIKNDKSEKIGETIIWLEYYKTVYRFSYGSWSEVRSRRELL